MAKTVAAAEFQAHLFELIEEAAENHEELLVVKDGKTLGTFVPREERQPMTIEEFRRRYPVKILGDIVEPLDEWDCMK